MTNKQEILQSLKQQILLLEGFKEPVLTQQTNLGRINQAFPNGVFPFAALHEFFCFGNEDVAASIAFIIGLLSSRRNKSGVTVWISSTQKIFPPALKWFGIQPHEVLFLHIKKENDVAWAIQEAIGCASLSAVVAEMPELNITTSRRFQLAIEDAGVGCFILRNNPKNLLTTAVSRWHIQPLHSKIENDFPGVGHPCWQVKLLKVRNGQTGNWEVEWVNGSFRYVSKLATMHKVLQTQTG